MWLIPRRGFDQQRCPAQAISIFIEKLTQCGHSGLAVDFSALVKDLTVCDQDLLGFISNPLLTVNLCLLPASYCILAL